MQWIRATNGGLYNADHIVSIDVIGDGDADAMVATLVNGREIVLARSGWGLSRTHELLAERMAGVERLIDLRELLEEADEADDELLEEADEADDHGEEGEAA